MFARTEFEMPGDGGGDFGVAVQGGHCRPLRRGFRPRHAPPRRAFFSRGCRRLVLSRGRKLARAGDRQQDQKLRAWPETGEPFGAYGLAPVPRRGNQLCRYCFRRNRASPAYGLRSLRTDRRFWAERRRLGARQGCKQPAFSWAEPPESQARALAAAARSLTFSK